MIDRRETTHLRHAIEAGRDLAFISAFLIFIAIVAQLAEAGA
jgi:hypothetical protein